MQMLSGIPKGVARESRGEGWAPSCRIPACASALFKTDKDYEQMVLDKTGPDRKTHLKSC
jgi:hypothetical protein